jgi:tRNA pseudouridine38-40 synthase
LGIKKITANRAMQRYFIEVAYKGTSYAGFQIQQNANTIQAEVEKALHIYYRHTFTLTGSSRTDAGVHALQNFFHFDTEVEITPENAIKAIYHLNSILPADIVVKAIYAVKKTAHCRFDALSRSYQYDIYQQKNPFIQDTAFYYPYKLNELSMQQAAAALVEYTNFQSFAKKNTQVFTYECAIIHSQWDFSPAIITYNVTGNRFLRGMVRGLVGTMLQVGREKITVQDFRNILESREPSKTDFSTPARGLSLHSVKYS